MIKNLKLISGEWSLERIPCSIIKHRVLKTDPTYKFVINADVYVRSNVAVRNNSGSYYYDLLNILALTETVVTGEQWFELIVSQYNIPLVSGDNYFSINFPEIGFTKIEDRDLYDEIYNSLFDSTSSDGLNVYVDFTIQTSKGFVKNKLGLNIENIQSYLLDSLSFNLLKAITSKDSPASDFKVKESYKTALNLSSSDIEFIEALLKFNTTNMPKVANSNTSIFWDYLNKFSTLSGFFIKQNLFGFYLENTQIVNIDNKDFNLDTDNNNYPMNVAIKNGLYNTNSQQINIQIN